MTTLNPLEGLQPPKAPESLRSLVLQSWDSRIAIEPLDVWDRIWNSRRLRLAWLLTVAVLLALNLAPSPFSSGARQRTGATMERSPQDDEAATLGLHERALERLRASARAASLRHRQELLEILESGE